MRNLGKRRGDEANQQKDMQKLNQVIQIDEGKIQAIVREIQKHGIRVRLRPAVAADKDLGRISSSTVEVVRDPFERTIEAFTLCHMFGHMVQFTTPERYEQLLDPVSKTPPIELSEDFWGAFYAYEREAYGYGATLLESSIPIDDALRSRYANFMEVDFKYFRKYISTNRRSTRTDYRAKVLRRYESYPVAVPIAPLPFSNVKWMQIGDIKATIY